jgi:hypothetical protein
VRERGGGGRLEQLGGVAPTSPLSCYPTKVVYKSHFVKYRFKWRESSSIWQA